MSPTLRRATANSSLALMLGGTVAILVHEIVHWLVGAAYGVQSTLYQYGTTTTPPLSGVPEAVTALSAPVASMVLGAVAAWWLPLRRRGGFLHLLWVWTAFVSLAEGVNYLVTGPFGVGDVYTGVEQLGLPDWATIPLACVGIAAMFANARWFAAFVHEWAGDDIPAMRAYAFFPWLVASPIMVLLQVLSLAISTRPLEPGEAIIVGIAWISLGVFAPMSLIFAPKLTGPISPLTLPPVPRPGIVILCALLLVNLVVLRTGLTVG